MKVFILVAISADGFIATDPAHPADWTSTEDKRLFIELTKKAGVMIMGRNTYDTIGKALHGRLNIVYTSKPLDNPEVRVSQEDPKILLDKLSGEGYKEVAICGGQAIYDMFLKEKLVDELYITIEPRLFGNGIALSKTFSDSRLKLLESKKLNDDTLSLHYKVEK